MCNSIPYSRLSDRLTSWPLDPRVRTAPPVQSTLSQPSALGSPQQNPPRSETHPAEVASKCRKAPFAMSYVGCIGCNVQVKRLGTTSNHYPETPYSQRRKYPDFPFLMMPKRSSLGSDVLGHFLRIFFLTLPRCQDFDTFHGDTGGCRCSCSSRISTKPDSRQCYISKTSDLFLWIRICKVPKSKSKESKVCKFEETEETTKLQNNAKHC